MSASASSSAPVSPPEDAFIRFRLSHIDDISSYKNDYLYDVRNTPLATEDLRAVPQLRIFGATDSGQRVVAHVHGVFPYLYIEYFGKLDPPTVNSYIYSLGRSINQVLSRAFPSSFTNYGQQLDPEFVAFIVLCKGIPFYGYHVGFKHYLKIYLVDKRYKKATGELLRTGVVMRQAFEVFEEHVNMNLQFMLDSNLYGCGWVEVSKDCLFRTPLPKHIALEKDAYDPASVIGPFATRIYDETTIPPENIHDSKDVDASKISYCALELDFSVEAILNRHLVTARHQHQDFVEFPRPDSIERDKLVHSVKELWDDERKRRSAKGESGPSDVQDPEMALPRIFDDIGLEWNIEQELREKVENLAKADLKTFRTKVGSSKRSPAFDTYVQDHARAGAVESGWQGKVRTTFEQVDAIYPSRMQLDEKERYVYGPWAVRGIGLGEDIAYHRRSSSPEKSSKARGKERAVSADFVINEDLWTATAKVIKEEDEDERIYSNRVAALQKQEAEAREGLELSDEEEEVLLDEEVEVEVETDPPEEGGDAELIPDDVETRIDDIAQPPPKKAKVGVGTPAAPSPPIRRAQHNPFASPEKPTRVRMAILDPEPEPIPSPDPPSDGTIATHDPTSQVDEDTEMLPPPAQPDFSPSQFDDLPADTFAAWNSTLSPTLRSSAPTHIPFDIRSHTDLADLVEPHPTPGSTASTQLPVSSSESSTLPAIRLTQESETFSALDSTADSGKKRVTFAVRDSPEPLSSTRSVTPSIVLSQTSSGTTSTTRGGPLGGSSSSESSDTRAQAAAAVKASYTISKNSYAWSTKPPTNEELKESIESFNRSQVIYRDPFYGDPADVPYRTRPNGVQHLTKREYGGREFLIKGSTIRFLEPFKHAGKKLIELRPPGRKRAGIRGWEFARIPPSLKATTEWLEEEANLVEGAGQSSKVLPGPSQIEGPTQTSGGFKIGGIKAESAVKEKQHLAILAIELQVNTRGNLLPDPEHDEIFALFYCLQSENDGLVKNGRDPEANRHVGVIAVGPPSLKKQVGNMGIAFDVVPDELALIKLFVRRVRDDWDPECFAGYEVHHSSWGYLLERTFTRYGNDPEVGKIVDALGRLSITNTGKHGDKNTDRWGFNQGSTLNFTGRHVLPIWRILKEDTKLNSYSFENVVFHLLHHRTPRFSHQVLTRWCQSGVPHQLAQVFAYWRNRVEMDIEMIEEGEIISQTSEFARVFGVDFHSVRIRGSQFKVESVMFRIAKPESFLLLTPNRVHVGKQNAAECTPLIMEPASAFFKGPLLVLDFQSLYPSVMIAYNYCYSTCLGRIGSFKGTQKLGITTYTPAPGLLSLVEDHLNISPNGLMFVKEHVRKSLLAKMLSELLDTRVMVKGSMKLAKDDKALLKLMNARQLGLKLLANVTYGYTSATFSGRMPCVEIADAIVQTGRETLEKAILTIHGHAKWGAEVVYGDTDSLFVYLPGKSKEDAFRIGQEIVDLVTSQNPRPIKLKFEKVYLPSVLLAKKRYVGFKYEHLSDLEPEFDAKGIETVRRDGFPALQMMQEKCLKILFRTQDLSQVKAYCQRQWTRIILGKVSPQDFIYAQEVRLGTYSNKVKPRAGVALAARKMQLDKRAEPEYGERVPFLLYASEPGALQLDKALSPEEFLADPRLRLDAVHYITSKLIPPLARIFNLIGADVMSWYINMPKIDHIAQSNGGDQNRVLLDEYFASDRCLTCRRQHDTRDGKICQRCLDDPAATSYLTGVQARAVELQHSAIDRVCKFCSSLPILDAVECTSTDCAVYYTRTKAVRALAILEAGENNVLDL